MLESRAADEEIAIADHLSCRTQPAALTAEDATDIFINADHHNPAQKVIEGSLIPVRIPGIENSLVEFREGDNREREPLFLELFQALDNGRMPIEVMDAPIRINQVGDVGGVRAV
jgi:hypothetical protein